jgi:FkbM family methyltransferase
MSTPSTRTLHVNGLSDLVSLYNFGLSDRSRSAVFNYPSRHLGAGRVEPDGWPRRMNNADFEQLRSDVCRLDDVLPSDTKVDLVKIDVEGHELQVLRGMERIIETSPGIVILFEKLAAASGYEVKLADYLRGAGLDLYGVQKGAQLEPLDDQGLTAWQGYALAVRPQNRGPLQRSYFTIYPAQLHLPGAVGQTVGAPVRLLGRVGSVLFYGPYWLLPAGHWTVTVEGRITGQIMLTIQAEFGQELVRRLLIDAKTPQRSFYVQHDLVHFECVGTSTTTDALIELHSLVFQRQPNSPDPSPAT